MSKPIFCATHPRACSTAFERVFMTRKDLACVHEPFGDAFYYGPERLGARYENDEHERLNSGFSNSTFKTIFERIERESSDGQRLFIKDIIHYLFPPNGQASQIAPSLDPRRRGIGTDDEKDQRVNGHVNGDAEKPPFPYGTEAEPGNPTVVPNELLQKFHWIFLIRNPHSSIPSYYRCTIPPLDEITGFSEFYPSEAGYDEVKRILDHLIAIGQVGPKIIGQDNQTNGVSVNGNHSGVDICLVDADDLLDDPEGVIRAVCQNVGLEFDPGMLKWDNAEDQDRARVAFEKWKGFHEDAIESKDLKPRAHKKKEKSEGEWDAEWKEKYGEKGAKLIRETVDANMADYMYLKKFAMRI